MKQLVLLSIFAIVLVNATSGRQLPAPGEVEAAGLKCTLCKYTVDFVCSTLLDPRKKTGTAFFQLLTQIFERLCYGIGVDEECCEDKSKFEDAVGNILTIVTNTLPDVCNSVDPTSCPKGEPKCGPQTFQSLISAKKPRKLEESSVRTVVEALYKSAPTLRSVMDQEAMTKQVMEHALSS
ncbi:unnamed protein product [Bursaphelenchus xylophilus]|uniref:(pine wood nematode) hypothetical protein n=1 Tax=Bursaphelenchus xylophilus TaxID=6326 RepID=A0A1I7SV24_BURXY|nr:unnamed protein product [Bursaphelenchus xylophilus]CAG9100767.1 unnamed protein product [Bursaphelenchus xylophilus]